LRTFWWLCVPLLVNGCALPAGVVIASYAADGVSYVATGKSVTDHGLSAATGHDCALLRPLLKQKSICNTDETERGKHVVVENGKNSVPRPGTALATAALAAPAAAHAAPVATKDRYVTVGSYLSADNAARAQARYAGLNAAVVSVDVQGKRFNRVVVGPLSVREAAALKARLGAG
jgi:cell division septation protein DedD